MDMWAVISAGGKQYKVAQGDKIAIEKVKTGMGRQITFDNVLLVKTGNDLTLGRPLIEKAKVTAKILGNFKEDKIRVVKFKSKSRYLRTRGHRQQMTQILIEKIQI